MTSILSGRFFFHNNESDLSSWILPPWDPNPTPVPSAPPPPPPQSMARMRSMSTGIMSDGGGDEEEASPEVALRPWSSFDASSVSAGRPPPAPTFQFAQHPFAQTPPHSAAVGVVRSAGSSFSDGGSLASGDIWGVHSRPHNFGHGHGTSASDMSRHSRDRGGGLSPSFGSGGSPQGLPLVTFGELLALGRASGQEQQQRVGPMWPVVVASGVRSVPLEVMCGLGLGGYGVVVKARLREDALGGGGP